ncbi:MAG: (2Fe-2S)-binding protein [Methanobacteriota archaeon]|nr:MAG: (2Fe-2S)-binding protein [Euryarchaeota archaeon]
MNKSSFRFWLNDQEITYNGNPNLTLLDFLRYGQNLRGTKIGCREGDCGACTVMIGNVENETIQYRQIVSCLTPMRNVANRHVVTIEGINRKDGMTLPQRLMVDNGGTQCGFCTVGFIVSMTAFCLNETKITEEMAIKAVDGNICRCTGYHSIIRSLRHLVQELRFIEDLSPLERLEVLVNKKIVPDYFPKITQHILQSQSKQVYPLLPAPLIIGGGTDLFVQKRHFLLEHQQDVFYTLPVNNMGIYKTEHAIIVPANATVTDLENSSVFIEEIPNFVKFARLISSTQIRNIATVAGNFVNASPIGDLSILFLTMETTLVIHGRERRTVKLRDFFKSYRNVDLNEHEIITEVQIEKIKGLRTNFEKVSKRTHLDIASVNTAISIVVDPDLSLTYVGLAIGGVSPIPLYLTQTSNYLKGKRVSELVLKKALDILDREISPIDDVRGSAIYKRNLAKSLFIRHFMELDLISEELAIKIMRDSILEGGNGHA